jgi:hypothetical protein
VRVLHRHLDHPLARAERPRRQQVAALTDPPHREREALALLAEDRRVRHAYALEGE